MTTLPIDIRPDGRPSGPLIDALTHMLATSTESMCDRCHRVRRLNERHFRIRLIDQELGVCATCLANNEIEHSGRSDFEYEARCMHCSQVYHLYVDPDEPRPSALQQLHEAGYRHTPGTGWMCVTCAAKHAEQLKLLQQEMDVPGFRQRLSETSQDDAERAMAALVAGVPTSPRK